VARTVLDLLPEADGCAMHLLSREDDTLLPVVFSPESQTKVVHPILGIEKIVQQSLDSQTTVAIANLEPLGLALTLSNMRALLTVPMIDNDHCLGTLSVYSAEPDSFEEGHQHILSILAGQAAIAITKARFLKDKDRERWAIRSMFQRYVSPAVVERLVDGREDLALGGKRQEVSILFADIRGFTTFSEMLNPEQLVDALNSYLALAVEAIMAQEGTLDKFMGDAVMAIFNAPLLQPDCTLRAVRAAVAMQQAIAGYNSQLAGHQALSFGVGIHTGQAIVGNIGTLQQMNYTAIGDTVNLAKRLQENATSGQIFLSQAAYDDVKDVVVVKNLGPLTVKGRVASENVYELMGLR
jgi:class 3 adenylate cyclase